jgi:hypothetical protein
MNFKDKVKILAIGNSFSEDAAVYIQALAEADGVDLTLGRLYIGGCSLATHWSNAENNAKAYDYNETGKQMTKASIKDALESRQWDFITMQQVSHESGQPESYYPYLNYLSEYVKKYCPYAIQLIHQTWAYETGSTHPGFVKYNNNQNTMFSDLKDAYKKAAESLNVKILPSGEAWQKARSNSHIGDTLCRDGFHGNAKGQYIAGAVWYQAITGRNIFNNNFEPSGISSEELKILKQAAYDAVIEYSWKIDK